MLSQIYNSKYHKILTQIDNNRKGCTDKAWNIRNIRKTAIGFFKVVFISVKVQTKTGNFVGRQGIYNAIKKC